MHKLLAPLALAGLIFSAAAPVSAQQSEKGISVTGTSQLSVTPDTARLSFGVITVAPTLEAARAKNAAAAQKVLASLKALNLPEAKTTTRSDGSLETTEGLALRTGDISVELLYSQRQNELELPTIVGYRVTNSSVARFNDRGEGKLAPTMSRIFDTVLKAGANQVATIEFSLRDTGDAEEKAMVAALANARKRAETLARESGVRIRGVRNITQTNYVWQPRQVMMNQQMNFGGIGGGAEGDTPLVAGSLLFSGSVSVVYEIAEGR